MIVVIIITPERRIVETACASLCLINSLYIICDAIQGLYSVLIKGMYAAVSLITYCVLVETQVC